MKFGFEGGEKIKEKESKRLEEEKSFLGKFTKGRLGKISRVLMLTTIFLESGSFSGVNKAGAFERMSMKEIADKGILPELTAGLEKVLETKGTIFSGKVVDEEVKFEIKKKTKDKTIREDNIEVVFNGKKAEVIDSDYLMDGGSIRMDFADSTGEKYSVEINNPLRVARARIVLADPFYRYNKDALHEAEEDLKACLYVQTKDSSESDRGYEEYSGCKKIQFENYYGRDDFEKYYFKKTNKYIEELKESIKKGHE